MNHGIRRFLAGLSILVLVALVVAWTTFYTISEREQAVVLQFGEPVASRTEPGLYWRLPFVQEVRRLPKTCQFWTGARGEVVVDIPTADGKKIEVTPWVIWRITDPQRFVQVLRTVENGELRVKTFVRGEVRNVISRYNLAEAVRSSNRKLTYSFQVEPKEPGKPPKPGAEGAGPVPSDATSPIVAPGSEEEIVVGREKVVLKIKEAVRKEMMRTEEGDQAGRGIEVVDFGIARIEFVPVVREAAFNRLIAFMESIASRYVSDGERRKQEILNRTEAEVQRIAGEGRQEANRIRGQVEADIIDAYAKAIQETGEFYNFIRTLEVYQQALAGNTRLVLTTDSDLLRLLKQGPASSGPPAKK
jgi:membrane protease subunit HflC